MATTSKIDVNEKRRKLAQQQLALRNELRAKSLDMKLSDEERDAARLRLQNMRRNGSMTRVRNRCSITGRPRAYLRRFGVCRIKFREMASIGQIPGVTKSSW